MPTSLIIAVSRVSSGRVSQSKATKATENEGQEGGGGGRSFGSSLLGGTLNFSWWIAEVLALELDSSVTTR